MVSGADGIESEDRKDIESALGLSGSESERKCFELRNRIDSLSRE